MNQTEIISGKLIKYSKENEHINDACDRLVKEEQYDVPKYFKSIQQYINHDLTKYIIIDDIIYEVDDWYIEEDCNISYATPHSDGSILFVSKYHCREFNFHQSITKAIKELKERQKIK